MSTAATHQVIKRCPAIGHRQACRATRQRQPRPATHQYGSAALETLLLAAVLVVALFGGAPSVAQALADALRAVYRVLSFALSLP
jgi:hypothetical protein